MRSTSAIRSHTSIPPLKKRELRRFAPGGHGTTQARLSNIPHPSRTQVSFLKFTQIYHTRKRARRAGLAPLELVLILPLLLFVMALMIIFGTAGAWKIRTLATSRQVVWRTFWPRTGANDPRPRGWPRTATLRVQDASPAVFPTDPYAGFEVVRGPVIANQQTGITMPVNTDRLDFADGLRDGFARIQRDYPLLSKMPPHRIDFPRNHHVLAATRWQYGNMGIPSNLTRRIPYLYELQLEAQVPELTQQFTTDAISVFMNPRKPDLSPLEGGDPEVYSLIGRRSPNFQPALNLGNTVATIDALRGRRLVPTTCESDPALVQSQHVTRLVQSVRNVPRRMANYYIQLYTSIIQQLEEAEPPPPGAAAQIAALQSKIEQLQQFIASLPPT